MGRQEDRRGVRSRLKVLAAAAVLFAALAGGKAAQASTPKILPWPQRPSLAAVAHTLHYYGGPVMAYDRNVLVLWGTHTNSLRAGPLNSLLTDMATVGNSNPYNVPLEYGTQGLSGTNQPLTIDSEYSGTAVQTNPTKCSGTTACTLQDADVVAELNAQITAGVLPAPVQAFG